MLARRLVLALAVVAFTPAVAAAQADLGRKPTAKEIAAIGDCATKYQDDVSEAERRCLFDLVATPCTKTPAGSANLGAADCYRAEQAIWDDLLNRNYKTLLDRLDDDQAAKARAMERAWIAYRDTTCGFYADKIRGSMAIPMAGACAARETARRALLLGLFSRL
ncbi:MAG: lysozyme inhibitor LprI family protein [Xanthobacteraceae bacterium]|jgi:uncharacterized protein YecT (DUF1311 family)